LLILYFFQVLWPDGTFFIKLGNAQSNDDETEPNQKPFQTTTRFGGSKISFEQQLEAARRASEVKKILFGEKSFPFKNFYFLKSFSCEI
jgi:sorting nexin-13